MHSPLWRFGDVLQPIHAEPDWRVLVVTWNASTGTYTLISLAGTPDWSMTHEGFPFIVTQQMTEDWFTLVSHA